MEHIRAPTLNMDRLGAADGARGWHKRVDAVRSEVDGFAGGWGEGQGGTAGHRQSCGLAAGGCWEAFEGVWRFWDASGRLLEAAGVVLLWFTVFCCVLLCFPLFLLWFSLFLLHFSLFLL